MAIPKELFVYYFNLGKMIKNEKQYQVSKAKLKEFEKALASIEQQQDLDLTTMELYTNAFRSQMEVLADEIRTFEQLQRGLVNEIQTPIERIPEALIKARIARKWTQAELAEKLNMKVQQIQRYEAENYESTNLNRLVGVASVLGLKIGGVNISLGEKVIDVKGINQEDLMKEQQRIRQKRSLLC